MRRPQVPAPVIPVIQIPRLAGQNRFAATGTHSHPPIDNRGDLAPIRLMHAAIVTKSRTPPHQGVSRLRERKVPDRKSTRLNSSHIQKSRMPSSA